MTPSVVYNYSPAQKGIPFTISPISVNYQTGTTYSFIVTPVTSGISLSIDNLGVVSGTISTIASYFYTVTMTDSNNVSYTTPSNEIDVSAE